MKRYIRSDKVFSGKLRDELVIMDIQSGEYYNLNHVSTRIWELMEKETTVPELIDFLSTEYDADISQIEDEVNEHIVELLKLGIINVVD